MATLRSTAISLLHLVGIIQVTRTIQGISRNPALALELMPLWTSSYPTSPIP
jgi:hypothetical protein